MSSDQRGIGHLPLIVLVLTVLGVIGGVGYTVAGRNKQVDNKPQSVAVAGKPAPKISSVPAPRQVSAPSVKAASPLGCKVDNQYIINGPRPFYTNGSEQLVLYNKTRDAFQPVNAQVWTGDTCVEVTLERELTAGSPDNYGAGLGLLSSDLAPPTDGRSYTAIISSGYNNRPEIIVRDDGVVMADRHYLAQKFKVSPDAKWRTSGWTGQKVILFHLHKGPTDTPFGQDKDPKNWFFYDVETDTFTNGKPPEGAI